MTRAKMYQLEYDDDSVANPRKKLDQPLTLKEYYTGLIESDEGKSKSKPPEIESINKGWIILEYGRDYYLNEISRQKDIIEDLTAKLKEFKKMSLFEFDGLELPTDYYDNDIYLDH